MNKVNVVRVAGMITAFLTAAVAAYNRDYVSAIGIATAALSSTGLVKTQ